MHGHGTSLVLTTWTATHRTLSDRICHVTLGWASSSQIEAAYIIQKNVRFCEKDGMT